MKPCPFCGSVEVCVETALDTFWGECSRCSACGPVCDEKEEAVELWNKGDKL
jgi:Lar family restriction alleviation protein